jgi:hypothetical protein
MSFSYIILFYFTNEFLHYFIKKNLINDNHCFQNLFKNKIRVEKKQNMQKRSLVRKSVMQPKRINE